MSAQALHPGVSSPLPRLAAVYAISVPLGLALAPAGLPWAMLAAAFAVALGWFAELAPWWLVINALFLPALTGAVALEISPLWALGSFAALMLVYGRIWTSRVPLFFSGPEIQEALAGLLPKDRPITFLDAGCGDARVVSGLAAARPDSRFEGIEHALVPWLLAQVRCWKNDAQCYVHRGDLWAHGLTQYDVVYAYLSPAVMERFWEKCKREMRPGSILVSAFQVPGAHAVRAIDMEDRMGTFLHICRIGTEAP